MIKQKTPPNGVEGAKCDSAKIFSNQLFSRVRLL